MKIGLIARADRTGLSVQTHAFWRNMNPHRTLVVDLEYCSGKKPEMGMYPGAELWKTKTYPNEYSVPDQQIDGFLDEVDIVFTCETPYNYWLFERARDRGIPTVLQYNYEFLEYLVAPGLPQPDLFMAPSLWHFDDVKRKLGDDINLVHVPVPIDRENLRKSEAEGQRTELKKILHTVGNPAMNDRNGTEILLEAMASVKSPVTLEIRSQRRLDIGYVRDHRVKIVASASKNYWDLYDRDVDLYVMPRRFGGLCLPMNEALGLGIPTMMTRCSPNSDILPFNMLIPAKKSRPIMTRARLYTHNSQPKRLAAMIDEWYENPEIVADASAWALDWADKNSWDALRGTYESHFNSL